MHCYILTLPDSYNLLLVKHYRHNSVTFCKTALSNVHCKKHYTNKFDLTQCLPTSKIGGERQKLKLKICDHSQCWIPPMSCSKSNSAPCIARSALPSSGCHDNRRWVCWVWNGNLVISHSSCQYCPPCLIPFQQYVFSKTPFAKGWFLSQSLQVVAWVKPSKSLFYPEEHRHRLYAIAAK